MGRSSPSEPSPVFRIHNGVLGYPGTVVLEKLNLEIDQCEFLLLTGPNGGGKTTLLKTIAGIIPPISGKFERNVTRVGYVPQVEKIDGLFPVTAREMVTLAIASIHSGFRMLTRYEDQALVHLKRCKADSFSDKPFSRLSGGQRQRVLLARALAVGPELLILDEPTSGIDPGTAQEIAVLLQDLMHTNKLTILLVAHDTRPFEGFARSVGTAENRKLTVNRKHV
jgi:zinc transport system ATP-binding protein